MTEREGRAYIDTKDKGITKVAVLANTLYPLTVEKLY